MERRTTKAVVAGAIASLALLGTAGVVPAVAAAATAEGSVSSRVDAFKQALTGLVTDGTLTQAQADRVAETLDSTLPQGRGHGGHGPGGRGPGLEAAAEALGITAEELRTELREGQTLGEVADEKGVSRDALVDALVTDAEERLATAVEEGRLTQEQADAKKADLRTRIEASLDQEGGLRGHGHRHGPPPVDEQEAPDTSSSPQVEGSSA